jgi:hypothetical protein
MNSNRQFSRPPSPPAAGPRKPLSCALNDPFGAFSLRIPYELLTWSLYKGGIVLPIAAPAAGGSATAESMGVGRDGSILEVHALGCGNGVDRPRTARHENNFGSDCAAVAFCEFESQRNQYRLSGRRRREFRFFCANASRGRSVNRAGLQQCDHSRRNLGASIGGGAANLAGEFLPAFVWRLQTGLGRHHAERPYACAPRFS